MSSLPPRQQGRGGNEEIHFFSPPALLEKGLYPIYGDSVESKDTSLLQDVFRKIYAFSVMTLRSFQCFISRAKPHVTAVFLTNRGHKVSQPFNSVTLRSFSLDVLASYEIQDSGIIIAVFSWGQKTRFVPCGSHLSALEKLGNERESYETATSVLIQVQPTLSSQYLVIKNLITLFMARNGLAKLRNESE